MDSQIILTSVSRKELTSLITATIYDALSVYTERNPLKSEKATSPNVKRRRNYHAAYR